MSIRDAYYFALLEVHNGRPISVKTCFKGQQGDLTTLSRTVCRCQKQPDGSLRPEYGFDDEENANCFIDPLTPRERLIILGGGHIAQPLCEFAARCDFSVTVVDDRMDFANEGRFPLAREVICDSFENAINKLHITPYDFVVVITRGHRHDRFPAAGPRPFGYAEGGGPGRGAPGPNLHSYRAGHRGSFPGGDRHFDPLPGH